MPVTVLAAEEAPPEVVDGPAVAAEEGHPGAS